MEIAFFLIILVAIAIGFALVIRALKAKPEEKPADNGQALTLLQNQIASQQNQINQQIHELNRTLEMKLGESARAISDSTNKAFAQASEGTKLIKEITQELVKVSEGNKQVVSIADQLKNLQDILKNPKQRGVLGEYYLESVLKNVLPPGSYQMQYPFKDGTVVDAVVKTPDGIIPVDSKFSLENYNRILEASDKAERERYETAFSNDLKLRIDETAKYVKPEEGTADFAFMFIPSEAVYYDLLINKVGAMRANAVDLIEYAAGKKKVMVVSPTTFLAYLQTVLQGMKRIRIEEAAQKIAERVHELGKHLVSYQDYMEKLGKNLGVAVSSYNSASKEFKKIDKDVIRITDGETTIGVNLPVLEKPNVEEDETENLL